MFVTVWDDIYPLSVADDRPPFSLAADGSPDDVTRHDVCLHAALVINHLLQSHQLLVTPLSPSADLYW